MRTSRMAALLALAVLAAACRDAAGPGAAVAALRFEQDTPHVDAGKALQLSVVALDRAGRPVRGVLVDGFRSEDPTVATVGPTGLVTGVAEGSTRIQAFVGSVVAELGVVVEPRGGLLPDSLRLLVPGGERRMYVDSWPLMPQLLPFSLRNAAGASVCGRVPLRIEIRDTTLLTADYQPARDRCAISLAVPRGTAADGTTMLRVRAGLAADSVEVVVHRTFYRVFLERVPRASGAVTVAAGSRVRYQLTAMPGEGMPAAGIPVTFRIDTARTYGSLGYTMVTASTAQVTTDSAGVAFVDAPVSTSTLLDRSRWTVPERGLWVSAWSAPLRFQAEDRTSAPLQIVAGEPDHIAVYAHRGTWKFMEWIEATGDTVAVGPVATPCPPLWPARSSYVGAAVVDRYGNPISAPPAVSAASMGYSTHAAPFYLREWYPAMTPDRLEYLSGVLLEVDRDRKSESATFTLSYPGVPSRTVVAVPVLECGA
ncbi:MAG TPA: Ig-like domain-containing protein [Longimicrobium sp.]|nr:Ig-like domain-containing protein [Longimicrobium sp.]